MPAEPYYRASDTEGIAGRGAESVASQRLEVAHDGIGAPATSSPQFLGLPYGDLDGVVTGRSVGLGG